MEDWRFFEGQNGRWDWFDPEKYGPDGERALSTAREFIERGALMSIYMTKDQVLREFINGAADMREICAGNFRRQFQFFRDYPDAVSEYSIEDDFTALGVDSDANQIKTVENTMLMCARLDPARFGVSIAELKAGEYGEEKIRLALLMKFKDDGNWGIFGYIPPCSSDMPPGNYVIATNESQTEMSCLYGSRVLKMGYSIPICSSVETLRSINLHAAGKWR